MSIRKVGGIYFWNIGRIGGSFHVSKAKAPSETARFDRLGLAACAVVAVSFLSSNAFGADLESQFKAVCASPAVKSEKLEAACKAGEAPAAVKAGDRFKSVGIGAEVNTLAANLQFFTTTAK